MSTPRRVEIRSEADIVSARERARELAAHAGFSATDRTLIATAISELARNIVLYAEHGEILLELAEGRNGAGITLVARDEGPGIPSVEAAVRDGFSTSGGLGLGLPGVRRLMDEFEIESAPGKGTRVAVTKWVRNRTV